MKIESLINVLQNLSPGREIEIECPNGLLVDPSIKRIRENPMDPSSKLLSYVISWQN
jgi:hypothetical protein